MQVLPYGNKQKLTAYQNAIDVMLNGLRREQWNSCNLDVFEALDVWNAAKKAVYKMCMGSEFYIKN